MQLISRPDAPRRCVRRGGGAGRGGRAPRLRRGAEGAPARPNVLFILTDDMTTSELAGMPNVQSLIAAQGTTFNEAYVSFPLCCPSRATMLSGLCMHNHGVRGNFPPLGGWPSSDPRVERPPGLAAGRRLLQRPYRQVLERLRTAGPPCRPCSPGWNEWYGKVSEDALYFDYQLIEKTGRAPPPTSPSTATSPATTRPTSSRTARSTSSTT